MASSPRVTLRGTVQQFNLSPKGVPEGLLLRRDSEHRQVVQVNFEPELAGQILAVADEGSDAVLEAIAFAEAKHDAPHDVYVLIKLETSDGRSVVAKGSAETDVRVRGKAVRLNHALRGEVNGAILDSGEFVHLRPHGAKAARLALGQDLDVIGEVRAGWSGNRVIEARTVNGIEIGKPPKPAHAHHPKSAPPGKAPPPPHRSDRTKAAERVGVRVER